MPVKGKSGGPPGGAPAKPTSAAKTPAAAPGPAGAAAKGKQEAAATRRLGTLPVAAAANAPPAETIPFCCCIAAVAAQPSNASFPSTPKVDASAAAAAAEGATLEEGPQDIDCMELLIEAAEVSERRAAETPGATQRGPDCRLVLALPEELFAYAKRQGLMADPKTKSFAEFKPAEVARVVAAVVDEYSVSMRQQKANALAAAPSTPSSKQQQQEPQQQGAAAAACEGDSGGTSLDLLLCLSGLVWSPQLLLALQEAGVGLGLFMVLTSAGLKETAAAFAAAEGQQFASALHAAEKEDPTVATELVSINDCNKKHLEDPERFVQRLAAVARQIRTERERFKSFVASYPLLVFPSLQREATAEAEAAEASAVEAAAAAASNTVFTPSRPAALQQQQQQQQQHQQHQQHQQQQQQKRQTSRREAGDGSSSETDDPPSTTNSQKEALESAAAHHPQHSLLYLCSKARILLPLPSPTLFAAAAAAAASARVYSSLAGAVESQDASVALLLHCMVQQAAADAAARRRAREKLLSVHTAAEEQQPPQQEQQPQQHQQQQQQQQQKHEQQPQQAQRILQQQQQQQQQQKQQQHQQQPRPPQQLEPQGQTKQDSRQQQQQQQQQQEHQEQQQQHQQVDESEIVCVSPDPCSLEKAAAEVAAAQAPIPQAIQQQLDSHLTGPLRRLALQCRIYSFFPETPQSLLEHLLQLHSFESLLSAAAVGGAPSGGLPPGGPSSGGLQSLFAAEPLASTWCVRETIPRDRFSRFLCEALHSRDFGLDCRVLPRTGQLLLALSHREWRRFLGASGAPRGLRCLIDLPTERHGAPRTNEVHVQLGPQLTLVSTTHAVGALAEPKCVPFVEEIPPEQPLKPSYRAFAPAAAAAAAETAAAKTPMQPEPSKMWSDCRLLMPGASCSLRTDSCLLLELQNWHAAVSSVCKQREQQQQQQQETDKTHGEAAEVEALLSQAQTLLRDQVSLFAAQLGGGERVVVRLAVSSALQTLKRQQAAAAAAAAVAAGSTSTAEGDGEGAKGAAAGNRSRSSSTTAALLQQEQQQQPQQRQEQEASGQERRDMTEANLETIIELCSPSGRLLQVTSDGSLWERNPHELARKTAASRPAAVAAPQQHDATAAAGPPPPAPAAAGAGGDSGGDTCPLKLGAARLWFGCPEDHEVHRRVLPTGLVIRETLSGRVEVFTPEGDYISRVPLQSEFASLCATRQLPPPLQNLGALYEALPPHACNGDSKQLEPSLLSDPFGSGGTYTVLQARAKAAATQQQQQRQQRQRQRMRQQRACQSRRPGIAWPLVDLCIRRPSFREVQREAERREISLVAAAVAASAASAAAAAAGVAAGLVLTEHLQLKSLWLPSAASVSSMQTLLLMLLMLMTMMLLLLAAAAAAWLCLCVPQLVGMVFVTWWETGLSCCRSCPQKLQEGRQQRRQLRRHLLAGSNTLCHRDKIFVFPDGTRLICKLRRGIRSIAVEHPRRLKVSLLMGAKPAAAATAAPAAATAAAAAAGGDAGAAAAASSADVSNSAAPALGAFEAEVFFASKAKLRISQFGHARKVFVEPPPPLAGDEGERTRDGEPILACFGAAAAAADSRKVDPDAILVLTCAAAAAASACMCLPEERVSVTYSLATSEIHAFRGEEEICRVGKDGIPRGKDGEALGASEGRAAAAAGAATATAHSAAATAHSVAATAGAAAKMICPLRLFVMCGYTGDAEEILTLQWVVNMSAAAVELHRHPNTPRCLSSCMHEGDAGLPWKGPVCPASHSPEAVASIRQFRLLPPVEAQEVRRFRRTYATYLSWEGLNGGCMQHLVPEEETRESGDGWSDDQHERQQQQQQQVQQQQQQQRLQQQQQQRSS
ncbi:hypothetical protein ACSSS7_002001 [Eimeria intestinalis]